MHSAFTQRLQRALAPYFNQQNLCPDVELRRQAAVLLALTDEESPHILLIKRSIHLPIHPGEIAFPGGKREAADSDLFVTALREAWEEVALPGESVNFVGTLEPQFSQTELWVTPIVGVIPRALTLRAHAGEVSEILYVPLAFFADRTNLRADRIGWNGAERTTARFQFQHYTIWGLTARFIVQLTNAVYDAGLDIEGRAERALNRSPQ